MAKQCCVCGKELGLFIPKAKTKDGKYICADDANDAFDTDEIYDRIVPSLKLKILQYTSNQLSSMVKHTQEKEQQSEENREALIKAWQTFDLSQNAKKVPGVNLKKNEYAYYAYNHYVTWSEERQKTSRINYGGLTGSIHIAKGLNYRLGSIKTEIEHSTYMKEIFKGSLLLTNKRIILGNNEGVKAYSFARLLKVIPYNDGAVLCNDSGKKVYLTGFDDATEFNIILDRLLTEDDILPN